MDNNEKECEQGDDGSIEIDIKDEDSEDCGVEIDKTVSAKTEQMEPDGVLAAPQQSQGSIAVAYSEEKQKKPFWSKLKKTVALVLVGTMVGGSALGFGVGAGMRVFQGANFKNTFYLENSSKAVPVSLNSGNQTIMDIIDQTAPSVVSITSKSVGRDIFLNQYQSEGLGSGVIFNVSKDSVLVLTNNHVIEDASEVMVSLGKNSTVEATVVGVDPETDIAVVKVNKSDIPADVLVNIKPAILGDSDKLRVGEVALAIGNPLGYSGSVSAGIISALDRTVDARLNSLSLIQTDAAINPGNSGGALVNGSGEVIGINTIKISDTKVEGIGFAIPINSAKPIIDQLLTQGYVSRPFMGISGRDVDEQLSDLYKLPIGVVVMEVVQGSSAADAGIRKGDVIVDFDNQKITSMDQLVGLIKNHKVGDKVAVALVRDGEKRIELNVALKDKNMK